MYSDSGIISEEFVGPQHNDTSLFDCVSCPICFNYHHKSVYAFFSERRRAHYDELNNDVFVPLGGLRIIFYGDENPHYILEKFQVGMTEDLIFYDDARRHMPKKMKQNIENFEKNLNTCNVYIGTSNVTIDNRIKEIIARPIYAELKNEEVSSIYNIVKTGFSQAIKGNEEVSTTIKNWDLPAKLKTYGFETQREIDNTTNILGAIQQDQIIVEYVTNVRNNKIDLQNKLDVIKNQSKDISSLIASHRYKARHRCCPSLIKEMWYTLF